MRIVDVCAFYSTAGGGVRTYVEQKLAHGCARGHEMVLIVPGFEDRTDRPFPGARIHHVASPRLPLDRRYGYFAAADAVHRLLDQEQPDVIEASSPWRTASIVASWRGAATRALVLHADPLASFAYRWFGRFADRTTIDRHFDWFWRHLRKTARQHDLVIAANGSLSKRMADGGVCGRYGIVTLPMGIDSARFGPHRRDAGLRARMLAHCALPADAILLLGAGRLGAEKRWSTVIDAVRMVGIERPIGLVLIGDGPERARLARLIGGNPHIRLYGAVRDRELFARLLASGDMLIHGCESETYGLVIAEAAASGLPLIVPDEGGARDLAGPSFCERYPAGDVRAAAAAIRRMTAAPVEPRLAHARLRAGEIPSMDAHFTELFELYSATSRAIAEQDSGRNRRSA